MENKGKAYAFFDCSASKENIEKELPSIRECVQTPNALELFLMETKENPNVSPLSDAELCAILDDAKEAGMTYFMEATYPNATNYQTAEELASILNQAYLSPLYKHGEQFRGEVVYKEKGKYIFRE
jgi:hypothetical protein